VVANSCLTFRAVAMRSTYFNI